MNHPSALNGAAATALHQGERSSSETYSETGIRRSSRARRTSTPNSSVINGTDCTISGYSSGDIASAEFMLPTLIPAIEAREPSPPSDGFPPCTSGASFTVTVYSLGMLKPMTSPANAPATHHLTILRRPAHSLRASSARSISPSPAGAVALFISSIVLSAYFDRFAIDAAIVPIDAADVARLMIAGRLMPLRSRFEGMTISHPGSMRALRRLFTRDTVPFM